LVINLDCPLKNISAKDFGVDHETYLHRVGRTGRYNDLGVGITLVDKSTKEIIAKVK
jgi:superfamily II DNA/RNA helicase